MLLFLMKPLRHLGSIAMTMFIPILGHWGSHHNANDAPAILVPRGSVHQNHDTTQIKDNHLSSTNDWSAITTDCKSLGVYCFSCCRNFRVHLPSVSIDHMTLKTVWEASPFHGSVHASIHLAAGETERVGDVRRVRPPVHASRRPAAGG